jgi:hypothetical protein
MISKGIFKCSICTYEYTLSMYEKLNAYYLNYTVYLDYFHESAEARLMVKRSNIFPSEEELHGFLFHPSKLRSMPAFAQMMDEAFDEVWLCICVCCICVYMHGYACICCVCKHTYTYVFIHSL